MIYSDDIQKIEIYEFETSNKNIRFLLSYKDRNFEVNSAIVFLIYALKGANSIEQVCCLYSKLMNKEYVQKEVEYLIELYIKPILDTQEQVNSQSIFFKKKIVSKIGISRFSNMLKFLFNVKLAPIFLIIIFCLEVVFFQDKLLVANFQFDIYTIIFLFGIFIFSSFVHELGHASACRYFGIDHGEIGFGFYLNFPVFYTDVSNVWRLMRKQRLVINFAGVYFQLLLLIPLMLFYFYTYNSLAKYAICVINVNFLITLNPFFKFDGYWIMSDLLGVPNLRKKTNELVIYYLSKMKNGNNKKSFLYQINKRERVCFVVYSFVVNVFFLYYFVYLLPFFLYEFVNKFPVDVRNFVFELSRGKMPDYLLIQNVLLRLVFFIFTIYFLIRIILKGIYKYKEYKASLTD